MDLIKRREGAFRELSSTKWDVIIVDEAHHLSAGRNEEDITDRHRLGRWLSEATDALFLLTATPHDGYDESFASLLGLLEPSLVLPGRTISLARYRQHLVRRLKAISKMKMAPTSFAASGGADCGRTKPGRSSLHAAVMAKANEMEIFALQTRLDLWTQRPFTSSPPFSASEPLPRSARWAYARTTNGESPRIAGGN